MLVLSTTRRVTLVRSARAGRSLDLIRPTAYVPASFGHYVENTGNTTLRYLEIFNTGELSDHTPYDTAMY
jgi:oxalate decarboxylase/phosphoglucose isomerase-like protein (cupin superfamily)